MFNSRFAYKNVSRVSFKKGFGASIGNGCVSTFARGSSSFASGSFTYLPELCADRQIDNVFSGCLKGTDSCDSMFQNLPSDTYMYFWSSLVTVMGYEHLNNEGRYLYPFPKGLEVGLDSSCVLVLKDTRDNLYRFVLRSRRETLARLGPQVGHLVVLTDYT